MLRVEIDSHSGFCGGVIRAIGKAEEFLEAKGDKLYSLGAIVHNEAELSRLEAKGLVTISDCELQEISKRNGRTEKSQEGVPDEHSRQRPPTLLIRAHGQAPKDYERLKSLGFNIIDCTCPVVLKIQKSIRDAYSRLQTGVRPGTIVIFGKHGHAEVLGLAGQVDGDVVICETLGELRRAIECGSLDTGRDIEIFSQTTMSPVAYDELCTALKSRMTGDATLKVHNTICAQVAARHGQLSEFAVSHDVIIFVSGQSSSNGKVLCELCSSVNPRTYHISGPSEINPAWFRDGDFVGVCGATSTPKWLLEEVAKAIENLQ